MAAHVGVEAGVERWLALHKGGASDATLGAMAQADGGMLLTRSQSGVNGIGGARRVWVKPMMAALMGVGGGALRTTAAVGPTRSESTAHCRRNRRRA